MDRRTSLQWMLAAAAGPLGSLGSLAQHAAAAVPIPAPTGYGTDPKLVKSYRSGELWPLTFSAAQRLLAASLCRLIIPADAHSPSAADVGVPVFIDEWISAPYPAHAKDRLQILQGLEWMDRESQARFGRPFAAADEAQQVLICDDICFARKAAPPFKPAAAFFARFRDLTAGGFYTTPDGTKDLGFVGNVPSQNFDGPPADVLKIVGVDG